MGVAKHLYNAIFDSVRIKADSYTFFSYFKTLGLKIYSNIFWFKIFKRSTFLIEQYWVVTCIN